MNPLKTILLILSLGFFAESHANDFSQCIVSEEDIQNLTALHEQSLANYLLWLENRNKKNVYPKLGDKFKPWAGREIGTSSLNQEENYLFDYIEFVQLADGCNFHSQIDVADANIRKIIRLKSSVYEDKEGLYVKSEPELKF